MRLLEIARTLAVGADLFLLDEPTAGVSPRMKDDIAGSIKRLQQLGKTVLIIEHDITFIQRFCNRIVVLEEGRIVLDDSPERVRNDARLQDIYFGREAVPRTA
jgi:ABC-type branched-subunit amino acid transport system ATPase component